MNPTTACLCVCAPAGHHHGTCQSTAEPGLSVSLNSQSTTRPMKVPACRPCYEAVRRALWAGVGLRLHPASATVTAQSA